MNIFRIIFRHTFAEKANKRVDQITGAHNGNAASDVPVVFGGGPEKGLEQTVVAARHSQNERGESFWGQMFTDSEMRVVWFLFGSDYTYIMVCHESRLNTNLHSSFEY